MEYWLLFLLAALQLGSVPAGTGNLKEVREVIPCVNDSVLIMECGDRALISEEHLKHTGIYDLSGDEWVVSPQAGYLFRRRDRYIREDLESDQVRAYDLDGKLVFYTDGEFQHLGGLESGGHEYCIFRGGYQIFDEQKNLLGSGLYNPERWQTEETDEPAEIFTGNLGNIRSYAVTKGGFVYYDVGNTVSLRDPAGRLLWRYEYEGEEKVYSTVLAVSTGKREDAGDEIVYLPIVGDEGYGVIRAEYLE